MVKRAWVVSKNELSGKEASQEDEQEEAQEAPQTHSLAKKKQVRGFLVPAALLNGRVSRILPHPVYVSR
jgi:hypothetical protein